MIAEASPVRTMALEGKRASAVLARSSTSTKNALLSAFADALEASCASILAANARDMDAARQKDLSAAMLDRLRLDASRVTSMAQGVRDVVRLPDPVGSTAQTRTLGNGLRVGRMRVPLGLIGMIYEARPNVTADAAALCIKSGNAVLLRGGSEALESNRAIAEVFHRCAEARAEDAAKEGRQDAIPAAALSLLPTTDRSATLEMLGLTGVLDLVIPRGGEGLIRFVTEHARVPVIQHFKGVCHIFVEASADLKVAVDIVLNAKTQRPGVCNAAECLLVDRACMESFLPKVGQALVAAGVEIRGDADVCRLVPDAKPASESDWGCEFLEKIIALRVVDGLDAALAHVAQFGSFHSEAIVTQSYAASERWVREVDASCVLVNASTRFNDGHALGLGAEMGISTSKMHCYGPMGLEELCTQKWVVRGDGQIR